MATKVKARKNGGATVKLDDDHAQQLLALLGQCAGGTLAAAFVGLDKLYPESRKYAVDGFGAIRIKARQ